MNEALKEEERRLRMLRFVVDINHAILMQQTDLTLRESFDILKNTRQAARNLSRARMMFSSSSTRRGS